MSDSGDESERKLEEESSSKDAATGDSASPSPRYKKTRLVTPDSETTMPLSRGRPATVQDLLVAGRTLVSTLLIYSSSIS